MANLTEFPIPTEVLDPADYPEFIGPKGDPGPHGSKGDPGDITSSGDATDGQVLTADGAGGVAWEDPAGGLAGSTGSADNAILRADGAGGGTVQAGTNAPVYNDAGEVSIAPAGLTGSAATSALEIAQTWNTTGDPTAVKVNVTNTASGASAKLLDFQAGGVSVFRIEKDGRVWAPKGYSGTNYNPVLSGIYFQENNVVIIKSNDIDLLTCSSDLTPKVALNTSANFGWSTVILERDANDTLAQRRSTNPQALNLYSSYTSATNYQRVTTKTIREAVTGPTGASVTTTISIPKFSHLIGVTTRVKTALGTSNGTTGYQVGDGSDPDKWGAITGVAIGTSSDAANFTAVDALGPSASDRTITLTATGGNFDGTGLIEVCAYYLRAEAD